MEEREKELKSLLRVKEESENVGLKLNIQKNQDHGMWSHYFMANRWESSGNSDRLYFGGLQNHCRLQPWNEKTNAPWNKNYDKPKQHIEKHRHYFADKVLSSQSYGFSSTHVWMWELDHKEGWAPKNWCFWTVMLEKTLESPLDCKKIKPVNPKGNQSWIFIGRTGIEAEIPILWPPDTKNWLIWKDPDAGKDWKWEEKGMTEGGMVGLHHWLHGHEFEQTPGDGEGQRSLCAAVSVVGKSQTLLHNWTEEKGNTHVHRLFISDHFKISILSESLGYFLFSPPGILQNIVLTD